MGQEWRDHLCYLLSVVLPEECSNWLDPWVPDPFWPPVIWASATAETIPGNKFRNLPGSEWLWREETSKREPERGTPCSTEWVLRLSSWERKSQIINLEASVQRIKTQQTQTSPGVGKLNATAISGPLAGGWLCTVSLTLPWWFIPT